MPVLVRLSVVCFVACALDNRPQRADRSTIMFRNDYYQDLFRLPAWDFSPKCTIADTFFTPHVFVFAGPCADCILPGRPFFGLKMRRLDVNLNPSHVDGSQSSVKVLTVQVVLWNLLQWRHFQHYSDHGKTGVEGNLNPSVTIETFVISICNAFYLFVCLRHRSEKFGRANV